MAQSDSDSTATVCMTATNDALDQILDSEARLDALSDDALRATYVRVRLAREAMGEFEHAEIVNWLADPCDDYLGQFARKLGLDVNPWTDDVVATLWDECLTDDVVDEDALDTVRASLERRARECVDTPDAVVLTQMLGHYADA